MPPRGHGPLPHGYRGLHGRLSLAGSISLRDIDSGAKAGIIASITTSDGAAHLEWVNQEISGDRQCHLCSTGIGDVDLSWKGNGFTASGLRTSH